MHLESLEERRAREKDDAEGTIGDEPDGGLDLRRTPRKSTTRYFEWAATLA